MKLYLAGVRANNQDKLVLSYLPATLLFSYYDMIIGRKQISAFYHFFKRGKRSFKQKK